MGRTALRPSCVAPAQHVAGRCNESRKPNGHVPPKTGILTYQRGENRRSFGFATAGP